MTDQNLVDRLAEGDEMALKEIYERYHPLLFAHAYRKLQDREEVRDMLQELFLYLWNNRASLRITANLSAYLYTAVRNRVLNVYRNQKVRDDFAASLQEFLAEGHYMADAAIREEELRKQIEKEIEHFPPKMKQIFVMSRQDELSHQEIADRLDISPQTVRTQVKRALRILRSKLGTSAFVFLL